MKIKFFALLATTAAMSLAVSAYAEDTSEKTKTKLSANGYETTRSAEKTTAAGTTNSTQDTVSESVDSNGLVKRKVKSTNSSDPSGLLNKKADNAESQVEEKPRGGFKQTTTRSHTDAEGTNISYKTVTDVDVDTSGNVTTTATTEKTVDPKGLMNETTSKDTTKSVNGTVVEHKATTTK